jgi:transposase
MLPKKNATWFECREFLRQLRHHFKKKPIIVVWDRLTAHRSHKVKKFAARNTIDLEFLPPYAPELNPVEFVWSQLKYHMLGNYCAENLIQLAKKTKSALFKLKRDRALLKRISMGAAILKKWS